MFVPDHIAETFEPGSDHGGIDGADGRGVRYLEWSWDPDPADGWVATEYAFLLRDVDGSVRVVHETHRTGLFGRDVWLRLLVDAGFEASAVTEETAEERTPREFYQPALRMDGRPLRLEVTEGGGACGEWTEDGRVELSGRHTVTRKHE